MPYLLCAIFFALIVGFTVRKTLWQDFLAGLILIDSNCSFGNRILIFAILILSNKKLHLLCKVKDEPEITLINELSNYLAVFIVLFFIKFVSFEIKTKLKLAQKENMGNYYFENDAIAYVFASSKLCHNWDYSLILNDVHIFLRKEYYWS